MKLILSENGHKQYLSNSEGKQLYEKDALFRPIKGSMFSKPSFSGRNVELGTVKGKPIFSNSVWFAIEYSWLTFLLQ